MEKDPRDTGDLVRMPNFLSGATHPDKFDVPSQNMRNLTEQDYPKAQKNLLREIRHISVAFLQQLFQESKIRPGANGNERALHRPDRDGLVSGLLPLEIFG